MSKELSVIGVVGMAVMGRSLALNLAEHGYPVSIYNRTTSVTEEVLALEDPAVQNLRGCRSLEEFVDSLEKPRRILLMIKSGKPVDLQIEALIPLLDKGDLIIDGGNSYFKDTNRRAEELKAHGLHFFGLGVSGGEMGARKGPAMMPGGDREAYESVRPMLEAIAAKAKGEPCCKYTSEGGAGHYVKMVHNGIEYADMEIIAEVYRLLKEVYGLGMEEMASFFEETNQGERNSYLMDITVRILKEKDDLGEGYLLPKILDTAKQKGTGKWTNLEAIDLGVESSVLLAGLNARVLSDLKDERVKASRILKADSAVTTMPSFTQEEKASLQDAILLCRILAYVQGFTLLRKAEEVYGWTFRYEDIAAGWRAGCIIRSELLQLIMDAFRETPEIENLLLSPEFTKRANLLEGGLRHMTTLAMKHGISVPALSAALSYFDGYRSEVLPANMLQAQRDFFGAHTYNRTDREGVFHHQWEAEA